MDYFYLKSRAKINLTLDVTSKRDDGYHNVEMIMQTVDLYDTILLKKIERNKQNRIKIVSNVNWLPVDERNLAYKAANIFLEKYCIDSSIFIELNKRIPVSAGLAGGSSNAAATLFGLRKLFDVTASNEELAAIGKTIGADVPYCLMRGTALAKGIGENLERLSPFPQCYVLIVKPPYNISTAHVYKNLNLNTIEKRPNNKIVIDAINRRDIKTVAANMVNVLETVTAKDYPIIEELKSFMMEYGAYGALMSGSGPSVFGLFARKQDAYRCSVQLKLKKEMREVFVTSIFNVPN